MGTTKTKVTLTSVKKLKQGETNLDTEVGGFGVRMQIRDKVYFLKTRINHRPRQFTIGKHGSPWNPTTARSEAVRLLGEKASGIDLHAIRAG